MGDYKTKAAGAWAPAAALRSNNDSANRSSDSPRAQHLTARIPNPVIEFRAALERARLRTDDPIMADSKLHRFHVTGDKPGTRNGWYVLHMGNVPAGAFGSWKAGVQHTWSAKPERAMTRAERAEFKRKMDAAQAQRQTERAGSQREARAKAEYIWNQAAPAQPDHPYLARKRVGAYGIGQSRDSLVIPICDAGGILHSLQFIAPNGDKRFLPGGAISGHFHGLGSAPDQVLCIAEGYATAATIHEATGHPVAVAFNAENLAPVAQALRAQYPSAKLIVCADDDHATEGNPGVTKATKAARLAKAFLAIPQFNREAT